MYAKNVQRLPSKYVYQKRMEIRAPCVYAKNVNLFPRERLIMANNYPFPNAPIAPTPAAFERAAEALDRNSVALDPYRLGPLEAESRNDKTVHLLIEAAAENQTAESPTTSEILQSMPLGQVNEIRTILGEQSHAARARVRQIERARARYEDFLVAAVKEPAGDEGAKAEGPF